MAALTQLTIAEARAGLEARKFSARELAEAHVKAVEAARPLNAFLTETPERALAMADASDGRLKKNEAGLLEGIPLAIKDLFCTEGVRTTDAALALGVRHGVELPIAAQVAELLAGRKDARTALYDLMLRPQRAEAG